MCLEQSPRLIFIATEGQELDISVYVKVNPINGKGKRHFTKTKANTVLIVGEEYEEFRYKKPF